MWLSDLCVQVLVTVNSRPQLQAVIARMERRGTELGREASAPAAGRLTTLSHNHKCCDNFYDFKAVAAKVDLVINIARQPLSLQ